MAITEEKGLGRKSLERKFRTGKRDMRKESENKNNNKKIGFFFFFGLATHNREAAKKYNRLVRYIARGTEFKSKKKEPLLSVQLFLR